MGYDFFVIFSTFRSFCLGMTVLFCEISLRAACLCVKTAQLQSIDLYKTQKIKKTFQTYWTNIKK